MAMSAEKTGKGDLGSPKSENRSLENFQKGMECIMGCKIEEKTKVVPLSCLHFICSDKCVTKLKDLKPGELLGCNICSSVIKPEQLQMKIAVEDVFIKKSNICEIELLCEYCVWNRPAVAYCPECPACLCEACKDLHPQTRITQKHNIVDGISEQKAKRIEKIKEAEVTCNDHKQALAIYCETCEEKICLKCKSAHVGHVTCNIENEKNYLKSAIDVARNLSSKFHHAVQDLKTKKEEILTTEWKNISNHINEQFSALTEILVKRQDELKREAKGRFFRQLAALNMRTKCAEVSQISSKRFIVAGEEILNNRADIAPIKFRRQYQEFIEGLCEIDKKITQEYDRFVDKDWHFKLDLSACAQAQKFLEEYCQVEYVHESGPEETSEISTSTQVHTAPLVDGANREEKRSPSRRIAVKSTGTTQLSANKLKLIQPTKTYSRRNVNSSSPPVLVRAPEVINLPNNLDRTGNVSAETDESVSIERETMSKVTKKQEQNACNNSETDSSTSSTSVSKIIANGDVPAEAVHGQKCVGRFLNEKLEKDASGKSHVEGDVPSSNESEKENSAQITAQSKMELEGMPVLTASTEDSKAKNVSDQSMSSPNVQIRSDDISSDSSIPTVSSDSEPLLGKRKPKRKTYPDFLDTEESFKIMRKQQQQYQADVTNASKGKRKLSSPKSSVPNQLLQNIHEIKEEDDENFARSQDDTDSINLEIENGQDYESSDGYTSESGPSIRRQSLRRRAAPTPDISETSPRKKLRPTSNSIDFSAFQEAPPHSLEIPSEMIDFPVQGQGRMKISDVDEDENEDYCCICLDGGEPIIVCCDFCPKVFHMECHIPLIKQIPEGEAKWRCNYDTTKEVIEERIASYPDVPGSENQELNESNVRHFVVACKFLMECYKIPEIPTMRWVFPKEYMEKYGKVPFHLKYIRERLCLGRPEPFIGVEEMLLAFRQMFIQAFIFYKKKPKLKQARASAFLCFEKFLDLVDEYYTGRRELFNDVHDECVGPFQDY